MIETLAFVVLWLFGPDALAWVRTRDALPWALFLLTILGTCLASVWVRSILL
jgi:hypothetical protein